jgi:pumilio homology domain family member 6
MPTATTTKSAMADLKRKSGSFKDAYTKQSKKPKIDSSMNSALKTKTRPVPVKKEELSDEDSDDSDSDGGVPLNFESDESDSVDEPKFESKEEQKEEESDSEDVPTTKDGLHPERAKAVVTNSMIS